ncbi:conserved hypothetical protein [Candidatus Methanoperedens nitroreducens]|uniref:SWIM-type domain-containing protein n=2 Tax=Candidatus Methanoperedens nitratireducens TaxID=1392998 RepID=A0A284VJG5_9EURY|nr:conserved hypothetical protein [Candidatus Methanoperedens nitroreducens]
MTVSKFKWEAHESLRGKKDNLDYKSAGTINMSEKEIRRVYSETIFERGLDYFNEGRVSNAIKLKEKMFGVVVGTDRYKTEVNLDNFESKCSCPYGRNCKHGVALLLQYFNGDYVDGDEILKRLEGMGREELKDIIEKMISMNPANLSYLVTYPSTGEKISGKRIESVDKEIKSWLKRLRHEVADDEFVDDFSRFIKVNENALTKEQIFYVLEFLIKNREDYGYFYDDYSDSYFGDPIFENLCDAFAKNELNDKDFEKLEKLVEMDDSDMLSPFFYRMVAAENAIRLKNFGSYVGEILDEDSYIEFLINCGLVEKARGLIEKDTSLGDERRFRLYLRINSDDAIEFARRNEFYSSLMQYYHEIGSHDEAVGLFKEVVGDGGRKKQLEADPYLYRDIFDSVNKSKRREGLEEVLRTLFDICYSFKFYELCVDVGIKLGDRRLLSKLIDKKSSHNFDANSKIKLLNYLKEDYREEVKKELKEFAEALIGEKSNYAYEKAVKCVILLREIMGKEEWEEYLKKLYRAHFRKMNLWAEFKKNGVYLKAEKGSVSILR